MKNRGALDPVWFSVDYDNASIKLTTSMMRDWESILSSIFKAFNYHEKLEVDLDDIEFCYDNNNNPILIINDDGDFGAIIKWLIIAGGNTRDAEIDDDGIIHYYEDRDVVV